MLGSSATSSAAGGRLDNGGLNTPTDVRDCVDIVMPPMVVFLKGGRPPAASAPP